METTDISTENSEKIAELFPNVMRKIAGMQPQKAVFRDESFESSPEKLNIEGIFRTIAEDTKLRVI